eukprot:7386158-Prymnesium_polylepis.1
MLTSRRCSLVAQRVPHHTPSPAPQAPRAIVNVEASPRGTYSVQPITATPFFHANQYQAPPRPPRRAMSQWAIQMHLRQSDPIIHMVHPRLCSL